MKNEFILLMAAVCFGTNTQAMELNHEQLDGTQAQQIVQQCVNKRRLWTPEEDALLTTLVEELGTKDWVAIAKQIPGRTNLQCRERWTTSLDQNISRGKWTKKKISC